MTKIQFTFLSPNVLGCPTFTRVSCSTPSSELHVSVTEILYTPFKKRGSNETDAGFEEGWASSDEVRRGEEERSKFFPPKNVVSHADEVRAKPLAHRRATQTIRSVTRFTTLGWGDIFQPTSISRTYRVFRVCGFPRGLLSCANGEWLGRRKVRLLYPL